MESTFGVFIRKIRNDCGLTLNQLAVKLSIDSANLSRIENGKRNFDEKRLSQLADILNIDFEQVKIEFYSDLFARKIYENNCSNKALIVAEKKIQYLKCQKQK